MKKLLALALVLCLMAPALAAQEKEKKEPTPFQVYSKDQTAENFLSAYNAYTAQTKDTANYSATAMLAYLNYYELEKNLDLLKEHMGELKNMQKFQYGNLLLELDRNEDAIAVYNVLNEASPKWSCPWRHKGEAYHKMKNYAEAEKALLMAIETRKEHYDAYIWLAEVYRDWGKYDQGLKAIKDGMEQYGKDIEDPNEEVADHHVQKLYLDLLQKNGKTEKYNDLKAKLEKTHPGEDWILK